MLRNIAIVSTLALTTLASSAEAGFWRWTYDSALNDSVVAEYDPVSKRFKWEFGAGTNVNGFWTSVSPGPQPRGDAGEFAAVFFVASWS